jgi:ABC-type antimicrobial peptide transport system permease subunit
VAIHVAGDPELLVGRLRSVAANVDPALRLHDIRRLDRISESRWRESEFLYRLLTGVSTVALLLSLTGIYSVMSFTVSRRTREIGVRVALGSDRRRIVVAIFRRPLLQALAGIGVGAILVALVARGLTGPLTTGEIVLVALYSTLMLAVCMLACIMPTRRALGIEPNDALRAEG